MRDYQRSRVYKWEHQEFMNHPILGASLPLEEIVETAKKYRVNVRDGIGLINAGANNLTRTIWMPKWARTPYILCHELAHATHPVGRYAPHGSIFMALYILRMHELYDISVQTLYRSAIDYKIDVQTDGWIYLGRRRGKLS